MYIALSPDYPEFGMENTAKEQLSQRPFFLRVLHCVAERFFRRVAAREFQQEQTTLASCPDRASCSGLGPRSAVSTDESLLTAWRNAVDAG